MNWLRQSPTKAVLLAFLVGWTGLFFLFSHWKKRPIIENDIVGYYSYLPAAFIYGDLSMDYCAGNPFFETRIWGESIPTGGIVQKYTMGLAVMHSPFFFTAHGIAWAKGYPMDGYSGPYRVLILFSGVVYGFLGLVMLRKLLLRWFSENVAALTMVAIAAGTNLNFYVINDAAMPHASLFFLITLFVWVCLRFFDNPGFRSSLAVGAIGGLILLVRPNHIVLWTIPVFIWLGQKGTWKEKLSFLKLHIATIGIWMGCIFLFMLPQLLYWHSVTGHWLHYSYGKEGFFWTSPQIADVLLSYRKGWLVYTPLMIFAIAGFFLLTRYARELRFALPVMLILTVYVLSCWWCWWYGGSFGSRPFIDIYGPMAIGLAAFFTWLGSGSKWRKALLVGTTLWFVFLNNFQSLQYSWGIIHHDSMTSATYWNSFLKTEYPKGFEEDLKHPDYEKGLTVQE